MYNIRKGIVVLGILLIAISFSVQIFDQPSTTYYLLAIALSISIYALLRKLKFELYVIFLSISVAYTSFLVAHPRIIQQSVFETIKSFLRGEETSIFIRNQLVNLQIPTSLSINTFLIIVLWVVFLFSMILVSYSMISWLTKSWFFVENLTPPLLKPIIVYSKYFSEIKKLHVLIGAGLAAGLFMIDLLLATDFPALLLIYTDLTFNTSLAIFSIIHLYIIKSFTQVSEANFIFGGEIGLIIFILLLGLIFAKRGITRKVTPIKERLRLFSILVFGISLIYITLYLMLDTFAVNVFPFVIAAMLLNSVASSRIEAEFQILFICGQLSIVNYAIFLPMAVHAINGTIPGILYSVLIVAFTPIIPAVLVNIGNVAASYEKDTNRKFNQFLSILLITFAIFLFFNLAFYRYSKDIYNVKTYIQYENEIKLDIFYICASAAAALSLGIIHILLYKLPLNPVAFTVAPFYASNADIIAIIVVSVVKMLLIKRLKAKIFAHIAILATIFYAIFNIVKLYLIGNFGVI
ncbi:MAG: hypothetical protein J7K82_04115 [Thermoproteales archaeon]|nr:hypothetical protein [Thermoproteales archaeon]